MGLDQYLQCDVYVGAQYEHRNVTGSVDIKIDGTPLVIPFDKISYISLQAGYWRKANAIHKWFVDNVQDGNDDCGRYYVSTDDLKKLLDLTNQVLADHSKAGELLPPTSGFFFGSTDFDDWYFSNLESTKDILEKAIAVTYVCDYYYHSSW